MAEKEFEVKDYNEVVVANPEDAIAKRTLLDKILEALKDIMRNISSMKSAYTKKEIEKLKEQTANIERAVKTNSESLGEIGSYVFAGQLASEKNDPTRLADFMGKAEIIATKPSIDKLLDGTHKIVKLNVEENYPEVAKQFEGQEIYFCPEGDISILTVRENENGDKVLGSYFHDLEQFREITGNPKFGISSDMFADKTVEENIKTLQTAYDNKIAERTEIVDRQIKDRELKADVSLEKMNETANYLKNNMPEGTIVTLNADQNSIFIENPELPDTKLMVMMCTDLNGVERISSIRLVDEEKFQNFDPMNYDKKTFVQKTEALAYYGSTSMYARDGGKVETVDAKTGVYTMQDTMVINENVSSGNAQSLCQDLAVCINKATVDMSIVNEVVEERNDQKEFEEDKVNEENQKENEERF